MAPLALPVLPGWRSLVTRGQSTSRSGSATRDRSGKSARDPMGRVGSNPAGRKPQRCRKEGRLGRKSHPRRQSKTIPNLIWWKEAGNIIWFNRKMSFRNSHGFPNLL